MAFKYDLVLKYCIVARNTLNEKVTRVRIASVVLYAIAMLNRYKCGIWDFNHHSTRCH